MPVIATTHKPGRAEADPLHGSYEGRAISPKAPPPVVEYEPDTELRDTEQVPLLEPGGIEAFFRREVLLRVPDTWIDPEATKIATRFLSPAISISPSRRPHILALATLINLCEGKKVF